MNGGSQYCLLAIPVTVILRGWKTCFFLSFSIEHSFILIFLLISFFCLNLGDSIFSSRQAKLMAVQELIVQACVWLPVGEWLWIRVRSGFTMTCFFLGTGSGEKAMGECWTLGCIGVPPRHLNLSLYSIQQKGKVILHMRDDSISSVSVCCLEKVYERWQFVKKCQTQRASNGLHVRSDYNSQITVNSLEVQNLSESYGWKNSDISFGLIWKAPLRNKSKWQTMLHFLFIFLIIGFISYILWTKAASYHSHKHFYKTLI